jgi:hypothetical protein
MYSSEVLAHDGSLENDVPFDEAVEEDPALVGMAGQKSDEPRRIRPYLRELFFNKIGRRKSSAGKSDTLSPSGPAKLDIPTFAAGLLSAEKERGLPGPCPPSPSPAKSSAPPLHAIQARNLLWGTPSPSSRSPGFKTVLEIPRLPSPPATPRSPLRPMPGSWNASGDNSPGLIGFLAPRP